MIRFIFRSWFLPLLAVVALVAVLQGFRWHRVLELTALPEWSVDAPAAQATSPTGYAGGRRQQVIDDASGQSQQWIAQTQLMLAENRWRISRVDYDNAPLGRANFLPMSYRLWLGGLAWLESNARGLPSGIAVEHAALYGDLLLQALCALALLWFICREFGRAAGVVVSIAWLTFYPLATNFLPGAPHVQGLAEICVLWSVVPLVAAFAPGRKPPPRLFFLAGLAGGLGLSLNLSTQLSVIGGITLGAVASIPWSRRQISDMPLPWRWWGWGGALASLAVYAMQYFPSEMLLRLEDNHPWYAVAWLALSLALDQGSAWFGLRGKTASRQHLFAAVAATLCLFAAATYVGSQHPMPLTVDITVSRLSRLQGGVAAETFARWLALEGGSVRVWATALPAVLIFGALVSALTDKHHRETRRQLIFVLGPMVVTFACSFYLLRWWNTFNSVAIVSLALVLAGRRVSDSVGWIAGTVVVALLGLVQLVPPRTTFHPAEYSPAEMQAVMERDLAQWIAQRRPDAIILAPPALTTSLWYYGGLRGITTFDAANREGLMGAMRLAAAISPQEAQVLLAGRKVTHIVLPSWDHGLEESAREISESSKNLFIEQLRDWIIPTWIRPVAYYVPRVDGFVPPLTVVLECVDQEPDAVLASRMATFFAEAGLPAHAESVREFARRFPHDLGVLVSLAEIARARGDDNGFASAVAALDAPLAGKADRRLTWERRVALAAVLAQGGRMDLAREQTRQCFAEAEESDVRQLSPKSLYRFLALGRTFNLELADPRLRELALRCLPPDFRTQLR